MSLDPRKLLIYSLLAVVIFFNLFFLSPLLRGTEPYGDDNSFHLADIYFQKKILLQDPANYLDSWCDYWNMGYPINHYYHHLSYLIMGLISFIFFDIPVYKLFNLSLVLLFSIFPLVIYKSLRYMKFDRWAALFSALVSTLIECSLGHGGLNLTAFLGSGLYTQLWAMITLPIAIACVHHAMVHKEKYLIAGFFVAVTFLFNSIVGFITIINAGIFIFHKSGDSPSRPGEIKRRGKIFAIILISVIVFTGYWVIPFAANSAHNGGDYFGSEESLKSYGANVVLPALLKGKIFDYNHKTPFMTVLIFIGLLFSIFRRERLYRIALVSFLVWLVIFCGFKPVLALLHKIPFVTLFPFSRAVIGLHFWGIVLCGIGLSELIKPWRRLGEFERISTILKIMLITVSFLFIYKEMTAFVKSRATTFDDFNGQYPDYRKHFIKFTKRLAELPDGRVFIKGRTGHGVHWLSGITPAYSDRPVIAGYSSAAGLESLNFYYQEGFYPTIQEQYNLFNLKYIVSIPQLTWPSFTKKIYESYPFSIHEVKTSGYFDLVAADILLIGDKISARKVVRDWMQTDLLLQKEFIQVSEDKNRIKQSPNYLIPDAEGNIKSLWLKNKPQTLEIKNNLQVLNRVHFERGRDFGSLSEENRSVNKYTVKADIKRDCFLLLKTTFHPYWRAYVDGQKKEIVMLSPAYMGVKLSPGKHHIMFRYRTGLFKWGLFLIALGMSWIAWRVKGTDALINRGLFDERYFYLRIAVLISIIFPALLVRAFGGRDQNFQSVSYLSNYSEEAPVVADVIYLSDYLPLSAKQDDGALGYDVTLQGHIISLGDKMYAKGLGTQSNSEIIYNAEGYKEFKAVIGLDNELSTLSPNYASVVFKVYVDDRLVFRSPIFYQNTPPREISIPLDNAKTLKLVVTDAKSGSPDGNLIWGDHADWADARFIK